MTYDYSMNTMYAVNMTAQNASSLNTINMQTGEPAEIGALDYYFAAIACDLNGRMYGITSEGLLCIIDKNTLEVTILDTTDLHPNTDIQSMAFDHNSGRLFHAYLGENESGLIEYDPATGNVIQNTGDIAGNRSAFSAIHGILETVLAEDYTPINGSADVDVDAEISVAFSAPVSADRISSIYMIPDPGGVLAYIDDSIVHIIHNPLAYETTYTVIIPDSALVEIIGTFSWSFSTGQDPYGCNAPTALSVGEVEANQVTLSWEENGDAVDWNIEYGPAGFTQGGHEAALLANVDANPYILSGLSHNTAYDVYVQAACWGNEASDWAGPVSFHTLYDCSPLIETFPWEEGFEDVEGNPARCWTIHNIGEIARQWGRNNYSVYAKTGTGSAYHIFSSDNPDGWLVTPRILIPDNGDSHHLTFWSYNLYTANYGKNSVLVSTNSSVDSLSSFVEKWSPASVSDSWVKSRIDLTEYAGDTIYIAFRYRGVSAHCWYVDDVYLGIPIVEIISQTPTNGAINVAIDTEISVTFDMDIIGNASMLANTIISGNAGNVTGVMASVAGNVLTVTHDHFDYETNYTVTIPEGAIDNYPHEISWHFTTMSDPTPALLSYAPSHNEIQVLRNAAVAVEFDKDIILEDGGQTNVGIVCNLGNDVPECRAAAAGSTLTMEHADFEYGRTYTVSIPAGVIRHYNQPVSWSFSTVALEVDLLSPDSNAVNVALNETVTIVFNDTVTGVDTGLRNVKITYDSGNAELLGVSASVTGNTLNIAHDDFEYNTTYTVTVPSGAVEGYNSPIIWSFTTVDNVGLNGYSTDLVKIYPNPSKGTVYIQVSEKSNIEIYDFTGKLLNEYVTDAMSTVYFTQSPGIYFIKVNNNTGMFTHKVIVF